MDDTRRKFVRNSVLGTGAITLFGGCKAFNQVVEVGASAAMQAGGLTSQQANSIVKSTKAIVKSFEDFTAEQEYYIGRTVAAQVFSKYKLYDHPKRNNYLNMVGLSITGNSAIPETFGGYHFAILDSAEINAFAAPGGFVFVTRGLLNCCEHEDALAAVLAHEIAHVQLKHGLQAIKKSRVTEAVTTLGVEAARNSGGGDLAGLVTNFEGSITDITSTMVNNGYSRSFEEEADATALGLMTSAGYSSRGMKDMLTLMGQKLKPGGLDFFKTHPSPKNRLESLSAHLHNSAVVPAMRRQRLRKELGIA